MSKHESPAHGGHGPVGSAPGEHGPGAHDAAGHGHGGGGHERRDVDVRAVAIAGTILLVVTSLSLVAMAVTFRWLAAREAANQPPPVSLAAPGGPPEPPEPRLQTTPVEDLRRIREAEEALLNGYAWVDRKAGVARIPVERAIERLAAQGIPPVPETAPAGPTAQAAGPGAPPATGRGSKPARSKEQKR